MYTYCTKQEIDKANNQYLVGLLEGHTMLPCNFYDRIL